MSKQSSVDTPAMVAHRRLVDGLLRTAAYPHSVTRPRLVETHISSVILTGEIAYKLKKPIDLGFLDFRDLEDRRHFCDEELRLNRRMAPQLYLARVSINGSPAAPRIEGPGPVLDYAVRMRQFDPEQALDRLAAAGRLDAAALGRFTAELVEIHRRCARADPSMEFGGPEAVLAPMQENFRQIRAQPPDRGCQGRVQALEDWTGARHAELLDTLRQRRESGRIRECHGDLHLANLVMLDGRVVAFDALEFAPMLRWIDVASELAFLTMDLADRAAPALANTCLDLYLEAADDRGALAVFDWYQVYRALVRAKIAAIRHAQAEGAQAAEAARVFLDYLALAESLARPRRPQLILMHGVSGSGKSHLAAELVRRLGCIRLRADVERKRLAGLAPAQRSTDHELDLYTSEHGRKTYQRLLGLAAEVLAAGWPVVVDATFLRRAQRQPFFELAGTLGVPLSVLAMQAPDALLAERIRQRHRTGLDPSEADLAVMREQQARRQPPAPEEGAGARVIEVAAAGPDLETICAALNE